jgi:hypothetical protein
MDVLVDQTVDDDADFAAVGRTVGQAVDVDGVTHLLRPAGGPAPEPGALLRARIVEAMDYDLVGEIVG